MRQRLTVRGPGAPISATGLTAADVVRDYRIGFRSRIASLISRREVLAGRAKFGILGDGKEVPQLALARVFKPGDWRAGYYRDQTLMFATGMMTLREYFAQLFADPDPAHEPGGSGRQMQGHFATALMDPAGYFHPSLQTANSAADVSPLASNMPVGLGLADASRLYRARTDLPGGGFSAGGDEVVFATIGDASTSEGLFFESINAAGVLQVPLLVSVWDDGYGISVPTSLQTTKGSISELLRGLEENDKSGYIVERVPGWDYPLLCETYARVASEVRRRHVPALFHVVELTQPQGHSTSGSHERYKSPERLTWEAEHDCLKRMRQWMEAEAIATPDDLDAWEREDRDQVENERDAAWTDCRAPLLDEIAALQVLLTAASAVEPRLEVIQARIETVDEISRKLVQTLGFEALLILKDAPADVRRPLVEFLDHHREQGLHRYRSSLYSRTNESPLSVPEVAAAYAPDSPLVDGRSILLRCFDANLGRDPRLYVLGEDVARLGDVNLVFEGLAEKHGEFRVIDTGVREATIVGQAIGAAMRGLRPVADIQYVDYLPYALQLISDQLASLRWRTAGAQAAPVIIRTKGHRLQGVWHAGSPMGTILHSTRGVYLAVPRNMTQAAGMYNRLLRGDNPAIIVEALSGYRLKERLPSNVGEFTVPLGLPEVLRVGGDITIATYGACCQVAIDAASVLSDLGAEAEVIDVQTLNPFDLSGVVAASIRKTAAVIFLDEDVPGGATAYMMQKVLEEQSGWWDLDAEPRTITASENRPAFAVDGEYFTKPGREDVVRAAYAVVRERDPGRYPTLFT